MASPTSDSNSISQLSWESRDSQTRPLYPPSRKSLLASCLNAPGHLLEEEEMGLLLFFYWLYQPTKQHLESTTACRRALLKTYALNTFFRSIYYVSGIVLGRRDTSIDREDRKPCLPEEEEKQNKLASNMVNWKVLSALGGPGRNSGTRSVGGRSESNVGKDSLKRWHRNQRFERGEGSRHKPPK